MEFNPKSVSAGFSHSAAIDENQFLYIWGDNSKNRLCLPPKFGDKAVIAKYKKSRLKEPVVIPLKFQFKNKDSSEKKISDEQKQKIANEAAKNPGMRVIDVSCGPNNVFAIGRDMEKLQINIERGEIEKIQTELKQKLLTSGNLVDFFNLKDRYRNEIQDYLNEQLGQDSEGEIKQATTQQENEALEKVLEQLSPYEIYIEKNVFVERIQRSKISQNKQLLNKFAAQILELRKSKDEFNKKQGANSGKELSLGDIEDYCMGYLQNNNKLFVFGEVHKSLCNFEQQDDDEEDEPEPGEGLKQKHFNEDEDKPISQIKNLYKIIKRPAVVRFPKFTQPIVCVSVGAEHALVLTIQYQIYAWGEGKNGALGFGDRQKQIIPRQLEIIDHNGKNFQIIQIAAGKFHSMCLSTNNNIFAWGESTQGRLGHGKIDSDVLIPKEIYMLSKQKPIMIAAGESHSAAINHRYNLFTWGSGSFGKLGHGDEVRKFIPQVVQSLESQEIVQVSCGTFHTMAINKQGQIFAFGQNKYGKLGIHYSNSNDVAKYEEPIKINLYKQQELKDFEIQISKVKSIQVVASTNHSLAITNDGQIYSWGYDGKGLLGRQEKNFPEIGLTISGGNLRFNNKIKNFLKTNLTQQEEEKKISSDEKDEQLNDSKIYENMFFVKQVGLCSMNTVILLNTGEVHVIGDNTYGQRGIEDLKKQKQPQQIKYEYYGIYYSTSIIQFPIKNQNSITYISCGAEHIFAQTELDEVFSWGRNDEGQLGIGQLNDKVWTPQLIKELSFIGVKQICCGDDYSAALNIYGDIFVSGSLKGGKLGLGAGQKSGYCLRFKQIIYPYFPQIDQIACGVQHMIAISKLNAELELKTGKQANGKTYAWGKNLRGQLGIGNKKNQGQPVVIDTAKEKFKKVVCGYNFSLGLSVTNKLYFWGNYKYFCNPFNVQDIEEPTVIQQLENTAVTDVAVCYKYIIILFGQGQIMTWGKYLNSKSKTKEQNRQETGRKAEDEKKEEFIQKISKFPQSSSFNTNFDQLFTAQNHSAAMVNNQVYIWGNNMMQNRLGMRNQADSDNAMCQPEPIWIIKDLIRQRINQKKIEQAILDEQMNFSVDDDKNDEEDDNQIIENQDLGKNNQVAGGDKANLSKEKTKISTTQSKNPQGGDEDPKEALSGDQPQEQDDQTRPEQSTYQKLKSGEQQKKESSGQSDDPREMTMAILHEIATFNRKIVKVINDENKRNIETGKKQIKNDFIPIPNIFDHTYDLSVVEFIRQEFHKKEKPNLLKIATGQLGGGIVRATNNLQNILKREIGQFRNEGSILALDLELKTEIDLFLKEVFLHSKFQIKNSDEIKKQKSGFISRICDIPFKITGEKQHILKANEMEDEVAIIKKNAQLVLLHLQMHPCYISRILQYSVMEFDQQKRFIKEIFKVQNRLDQIRCNYLQIYIFEKIFEQDIKRFKYKVDNEDLFDENNIPYIFGKDCEMISIYMFRRIFKSNQNNPDTVISIVCQLINSLISMNQQASSLPFDNTFDLKDELCKKNSEAQSKGKRGKQVEQKATGGELDKRQGALVNFIKKITQAILQNGILKDSSSFFSFRKRITEQLEYVKTQFKTIVDFYNANENNNKSKKQIALDPDEVKKRYPSIRFSEEIYLLIHIIQKVLTEKVIFYPDNDINNSIFVINQILGLLFSNQLNKIQSKLKLFIMPYLSKVKTLPMLDEAISSTHEVNIKNSIHALDCFFTGQKAFNDKKDENHIKLFNQTFEMEMRNDRQLLLDKVLFYGQEVYEQRAYKNFENQINHSLQQEDSLLYFPKKLLGEVLLAVKLQIGTVCLQDPPVNDPLFEILEGIDNKYLDKLSEYEDYNGKVALRLKTRLFISFDLKSGPKKQKFVSEKIARFVRCIFCSSMLNQEMAVTNFSRGLVKTLYVAQDKQSLLTQFCEILVNVENNPSKNSQNKKIKGQEIKDHKWMIDFLDAAQYVVRKSGNHKLSVQIQDFVTLLDYKVCNFVEAKNELRITNSDTLEEEAVDFTEDEEQRLWLQVEKDNESRKESEKLNEKNMQKEVNLMKKKIKAYDIIIFQILKEAEQRIHQRILERYQSLIILDHFHNYLFPQAMNRIEAFKISIIKQTVEMKTHYNFGHANSDLFAIQGKPLSLSQLQQVRGFVDQQQISKQLKASILDRKAYQKMRGYLSLNAADLLSDKTIVKVRLQELEDLLKKSQVVLIESEDMNSIEFKLVFRETAKQLCAPDKILQEHIILNFKIDRQKLKQKLAQIAVDIRLQKFDKKLNKDEDETGMLLFEENDAIGFDPDKFQLMIMKMERQKISYQLKALDEKQEKP